MVNSGKEYSAARKLAWDAKEKDRAKIQAMARQVANLYIGCLSHHQGLAAALPSKGVAGAPPAKAARATSSPPDFQDSGSSTDGQAGSPGRSNLAEPTVAAVPLPAPTAGGTPTAAPLPSIHEGFNICRNLKGSSTILDATDNALFDKNILWYIAIRGIEHS